MITPQRVSEDDPGVEAAVRYIIKEAIRERFFHNVKSTRDLSLPQQIRGTRVVSSI